MKLTTLLRQRRPGQAIVLAALAFVLLVAMLGLAIDGANAFGQRRRLSNAVDAAAMAATRELIRQKDSGSGAAINQAIGDFLSDRHGYNAAALTWAAFYVERLDPEGSLGPVTDAGNPPSAADGVRVEVRFRFPTYFMGVFGQQDLGVSAAGTAVYGPLGTAVGQDLAPVALSVSGLEILKREGTVDLDMRGRMAADNFWDFFPDLIPDDVITQANIRHVSFSAVAGLPVTGDDCSSSMPVDNLTYWWCHGSPNKLPINRELPSADPSWSNLNSAIRWRTNNRPLLVVPVYADSLRFEGGTLVPYSQLVNFVAVEIRRFNRSQGVLTIRHDPNYATSGAMIGDGSGVETGVWAVNLTR
ncbi:MAG: hypothetical protein HC822_14150 [Oscillochloris sp.]|nr:hypothetical protein [Oscillochloris sp.]